MAEGYRTIITPGAAADFEQIHRSIAADSTHHANQLMKGESGFCTCAMARGASRDNFRSDNNLAAEIDQNEGDANLLRRKKGTVAGVSPGRDIRPVAGWQATADR